MVKTTGKWEKDGDRGKEKGHTFIFHHRETHIVNTTGRVVGRNREGTQPSKTQAN